MASSSKSDRGGSDLVSVVMPLFNGAKTVRSSIESVLCQSHNNLELLVVDDASNDSGPEIVEEMARADRRISLERLKVNKGAGVSRNTAIEKAVGGRIAFLDSDDLWLPEKLAKQLAIFRREKVSLVSSWYDVIKEDGNRLATRKAPKCITWHCMLMSNRIGCLTAVYNSELIGKVYMPDIRKRQDYALWLKIIKNFGPAFCIQESLAKYNLSSNSISSNKMEMLKWNYRMFRETQGFSVTEAGLVTLQNAIYKLVVR